MKKTCIFLALVGLLAFSGCKKCITCTEANSNYSTDYCGTKQGCKTFEDGLKSEGSAYGQSWTCVDN